MRLVLKLALSGLSNAEVCGGEVISEDGKASILAPGAGEETRPILCRIHQLIEEPRDMLVGSDANQTKCGDWLT